MLRDVKYSLTKPPSLAEILAWLTYLSELLKNYGASTESIRLSQIMESDSVTAVTKACLLKTPSDQDKLNKIYLDFIAEMR